MSGCNGRYILDGHKPVPEPDLLKWAEWFETVTRHVATKLVGDVSVSTVFLGLDHSFGASEVPVLFETMVFGGPLAEECERYSSWEEAETGHHAMVERVWPTKKGD